MVLSSLISSTIASLMASRNANSLAMSEPLDIVWTAKLVISSSALISSLKDILYFSFILLPLPSVRSFSFTYTPYYWLTVSSLAVLLFFAGLFVSSFWFSDRWEEMFKGNIEFLVECKPDLTETELISIENKLSTLEGVQDLRFVSAQDAMNVMKEELGEIALPDSMANPFRASFRFKLNAERVDTVYAKQLEQEIMKIDGVTAFYYPEDLYSEVRGRLKSISLMIGAIGGILLLLILVMIHHQIRMYI